MSQDDIDEFLRERGTGVLAMTDGTDTYAIPESFGYDGEHIYFSFVYGQESDKMEFVEASDTVTLTTYTETPPRSVMVRGPIEAVSEEKRPVASGAIADNSVLPTLNVVPDQSFDELSYEYYRLIPQERTGREFGTFVG